MTFIIKACAPWPSSLVPAANAVWAGDRVLQLKPVRRRRRRRHRRAGCSRRCCVDADTKSLSDPLRTEMKDLAATRARGTASWPRDEYQGGSFAISNLGMFGLRQFRRRYQPAARRHLWPSARAPKTPLVGRARRRAWAWPRSCRSPCRSITERSTGHWVHNCCKR